ncbi:uncharacterized protein LOC129747907 [Uranotaenia lowii]|uniref:uncharacterized protein LOC129747907 n=1 Tax=Uranotaenia lowii TaxID=190385 RepID=UPI002478A767|nr:uncharacterized protein LOC129747907 [Uranotaenia lowii]
MGTAWPQKYYSSRGHASAKLTPNKIFSHLATTAGYPSYHRAPLIISNRNESATTKAKQFTAFGGKSGITRSSSNSRDSPKNNHNGRSKGAAQLDAEPFQPNVPKCYLADGSGPVAASEFEDDDDDSYEDSCQSWRRFFLEAIFSAQLGDDYGEGHFREKLLPLRALLTLEIDDANDSSLLRPWQIGDDRDGRASIKAAQSATANTKTNTRTTMNASNQQVILNRFVRLTITLLITRTLMLRPLVQQLLATVMMVPGLVVDDCPQLMATSSRGGQRSAAVNKQQQNTTQKQKAAIPIRRLWNENLAGRSRSRKAKTKTAPSIGRRCYRRRRQLDLVRSGWSVCWSSLQASSSLAVVNYSPAASPHVPSRRQCSSPTLLKPLEDYNNSIATVATVMEAVSNRTEADTATVAVAVTVVTLELATAAAVVESLAKMILAAASIQVAAAAVEMKTAAVTTMSIADVEGEGNRDRTAKARVITVGQSQPAQMLVSAAREEECSGWCGCSCQRYSLLTCSRFSMERPPLPVVLA